MHKHFTDNMRYQNLLTALDGKVPPDIVNKEIYKGQITDTEGV